MARPRQVNAAAPVLEVGGLRVRLQTRRGVVQAVDDVSFAVAAGETLGIVGESGCGKTMTALAIQRMLPQPGGRITGGFVRLNGRDIATLPEREMRAKRLAEGIPVDETSWGDILKAAERLKVDPAEINRLAGLA